MNFSHGRVLTIMQFFGLIHYDIVRKDYCLIKMGILSQVCTILAEMWCLFRQTNFASTKLECLGYSPDESTLQKFWKLCEQQLNISGKQTLLSTVMLRVNRFKKYRKRKQYRVMLILVDQHTLSAACGRYVSGLCFTKFRIVICWIGYAQVSFVFLLGNLEPITCRTITQSSLPQLFRTSFRL